MFKNIDGYSEDNYFNIESFSNSNIEAFSNSNNLESVTVANSHKSLPLKDVACETKCTNGKCYSEIKNGTHIYRCDTNNESFAYLNCDGDGNNRKCYKEKLNGLCSNGIGGPVSSGFTKSLCLRKNSKQYSTKDSTGKKIVIKDHVKEGLVFKKNIDKDQFYNFDKCTPWLNDRNKKAPSEECLQQIWNDTGCNPRPNKPIKNSTYTDPYNFERNYLDLQYWRNNGCGKYGINTSGAVKVANTAENKIILSNLSVLFKSMSLERFFRIVSSIRSILSKVPETTSFINFLYWFLG